MNINGYIVGVYFGSSYKCDAFLSTRDNKELRVPRDVGKYIMGQQETVNMLQANNGDLVNALQGLMDYTKGLIKTHFDDPSRIEEVDCIGIAEQTLNDTEAINQRKPIETALSFAASAIKCGDTWSPSCEKVFNAAWDALQEERG
ncbi:hypothetical protein WH95_18355 [Kiloniella litopenaei]|uniref:Uncharacterized protein n=2 Tax=Kiloniella litopenaei TaxID=1549748 RepID=A0A0M2R4N9_9PROT|nr:hypothetical protein WH95_18355 [Kiloniella litopenaei]